MTYIYIVVYQHGFRLSSSKYLHLFLQAVHFLTFYVPLWGAILFNGFTYFQVIRMLNNATRVSSQSSNYILFRSPKQMLFDVEKIIQLLECQTISFDICCYELMVPAHINISDGSRHVRPVIPIRCKGRYEGMLYLTGVTRSDID